MPIFSVPSIDSSFNRQVDDSLASSLGRPLSNEEVLNVFKKNESQRVIVKGLLDRIHGLNCENQKLKEQVDLFREEKSKSQTFSYANGVLRGQLNDFFGWAFVVSILLIGADTAIELQQLELGYGLRIASGAILGVCAYFSWSSSKNNKTQVDSALCGRESDN